MVPTRSVGSNTARWTSRILRSVIECVMLSMNRLAKMLLLVLCVGTVKQRYVTGGRESGSLHSGPWGLVSRTLKRYRVRTCVRREVLRCQERRDGTLVVLGS